MKVSEFKKAVASEYAKHFEGSRCNVNLTNILGSTLWIKCYLSANDGECYNNIGMNDMLHVVFCIDRLGNGMNDDSELPEELEMVVHNKDYLTKPDNKYCVYGSHALPFRKVRGNAAKVVKSLGKYFATLHDSLQADLDAGKITADHVELLKKRLVSA